MTQSAPNSISYSDLERLAGNAQQEDKIDEAFAGPHDGLTDEQVMRMSCNMLDDLYEACGSPIIHKVAAMQCIHNLMVWHINMANSQAEAGDQRSAFAWASDAGRLKDVLDLLRNVSIYPDDFTHRPDEAFSPFNQTDDDETDDEADEE